MDKFQMAIRWIICLALLVMWTGGCEDKAKAPVTPKVVTKKIASQKVAVKPAAKKPAVTAKAPEKAEKMVVAKKVTQPAAVKAEKVVAPKPAPAPATPDEKVVAEKAATKPPMAPDSAPAPVVLAETSPASTSAASEVQPQTSLLIYNPIGKVDPFRPLLAQKPDISRAKPKELTRPLTELEKLDIGQLKLTAVIIPSTGANALAMVEEKNTGKGYVVRKGTYMGNNSGQIVEILSDRIILEEELSIGGNIEIRQRELKIQKSGER